MRRNWPNYVRSVLALAQKWREWNFVFSQSANVSSTMQQNTQNAFARRDAVCRLWDNHLMKTAQIVCNSIQLTRRTTRTTHRMANFCKFYRIAEHGDDLIIRLSCPGQRNEIILSLAPQMAYLIIRSCMLCCPRRLRECNGPETPLSSLSRCVRYSRDQTR